MHSAIFSRNTISSNIHPHITENNFEEFCSNTWCVPFTKVPAKLRTSVSVNLQDARRRRGSRRLSSTSRVRCIIDKPKENSAQIFRSRKTVNVAPSTSSPWTMKRGNYFSRRVTIFDREENMEVQAVIVARSTPAHVGYTTGNDVWTLDIRLESNYVKIGDLVVQLTPSINAGLTDATIFSILNFDTKRFGGVGMALIGHLVYGSWKNSEFVMLDNIKVENVDGGSLYFWHSLGFRFSSGSDEEDFYICPKDLDRQLQALVEECSKCCQLELDSHSSGDMGEENIPTSFGCCTDCVGSQAYRISGDTYDMSCQMQGMWQ